MTDSVDITDLQGRTLSSLRVKNCTSAEVCAMKHGKDGKDKVHGIAISSFKRSCRVFRCVESHM